MSFDGSARTRVNRRWRLRILLAMALGLYLLGEPFLDHYFGRAFIHPSASPELNQASRRLIAEVKALRGDVKFHSLTPGYPGLIGSRELFAIRFYGQEIGDETLARLRTMCGDRIAVLDLRNTKVTDEGLRHLEGLSHLQQLSLGNERWESPQITMPTSPITDAGLVHLRGLNGLVNLSLNGLPITDAGLDMLKDLPTLGGLYLRRTKVEGSSLRRFKSLPRLALLDLDESAVNDEGLASLPGATNLQHLSLNRVSLTGEGLKHLKTLPRLQTLEITGCGLLDEEVADFRRANPRVKVERH